ncbi:CDP-alcohol phosphatidyltransferase [Lipomyces kononenkoae]|uniref:CDP-alcohol phosphatidyltransferase n=1 Tax=Lipomyces kononenkoae TaxID=34357 RepID=A0ACC3SVC8_LIPKO
MFDIALRRLKDNLVDPICRIFPLWVTPHASPSHVSRSWPLLFWLLNRTLDSFDGALARQRGIATELGGFLDLLGDFIVYSLLPVSIACGQDLHMQTQFPNIEGVRLDWRAVAILEASFHINNFVLFYIAAVAVKQDRKELTSITMLPALIEGFESGLIFTAMLIWRQYIVQLCWAMSAAVAFGTVQRVFFVVTALKRLERARKV